MIIKNYKSIFSYVTALALGLILVNCDQEDNTGYSTLEPTSPNLEISISETNVVLIEDNSEFTFTANISEAQLVDVKLYAYQVGGDADGDDFTLDGSIVIAAGSTSAKGKLKILQDDILEETETLKIQVGDNRTANTSQSSAFMDYTILNYTEGDLDIQLSWEMGAPTTDNSGDAIDPEDFADMRLLISSNPDNSGDIAEADGSGFEHLVLSGDTPDGEYYIVTDFFEANKEIIRDLNLNLVFNEIGLINGLEHNYPSAIDNSKTCAYFVMAKIVKAGDSYTITDISQPSDAITDLSAFEGTWTGTTAYGHPTQVVTTLVDENTLSITGIGVGFMENDWGEVITDMATLTMDVDLITGELTIVETPYMTTTYNGDVQPVYNLSATGTLNQCTLGMYLDYDFIQDGTSYTEWLTEGNGWPPFVEDITIE